MARARARRAVALAVVEVLLLCCALAGPALALPHGSAVKTGERDPHASTHLSLADALVIEAEQMCPWLMDLAHSRPETACHVVGVVQKALLGDAFYLPERCPEPRLRGTGRQIPAAPLAANGEQAPKVLADVRPAPAQFADVPGILEMEGATYAWYWANLRNLRAWWPCARGGGGALDFAVPDGWAPIGGSLDGAPGVYYLPQYGGGALPFMVVLERRGDGPDAGHVTVLLRGTNTPTEWQQDLTYSRLAGVGIPGTGSTFRGEVHAGYAAVFDRLWPWVHSVLEQQLAARRLAHVTFSGHSLGAGAAALMSYAAARLLRERGAAGAVVHAVLFGAPNAGNSVFAAAHRELVNTRRVAFRHDAFSLLPCAGGTGRRGMPVCSRTPIKTEPARTQVAAGRAAPAGGAGSTVPGGGAAAPWSDYQPLAGGVMLEPEDMPVQPEMWRRTRRMRLSTSAVAHVCAYSCALAGRLGDARDTRCLLREPLPGEAAAAGHTYCPGFPAAAVMLDGGDAEGGAPPSAVAHWAPEPNPAAGGAATDTGRGAGGDGQAADDVLVDALGSDQGGDGPDGGQGTYTPERAASDGAAGAGRGVAVVGGGGGERGAGRGFYSPGAAYAPAGDDSLGHLRADDAGPEAADTDDRGENGYDDAA